MLELEESMLTANARDAWERPVLKQNYNASGRQIDVSGGEMILGRA